MPTIHFVDGEKGGVGKSMFARCLAHYFECHQLDYTLVDADTNNDVFDCYGGIADISFKLADEEIALSSVEANKVDQIFEAALEKPVLVNLPANVHEQVTYWITSNDLLSELITEESGVTIIKWFLSNGEFDSLKAFNTSLGTFEDKLSHILVRNKGLLTNWSKSEQSDLYQETYKQHQFTVIDFPGLPKTEQNYIQELRIPLSQILTNRDLSILSRQRLTKFVRETLAAIDQTGIFQNSLSSKQTTKKETVKQGT